VGDVAELAASIASVGIIEPLIVAEASGERPFTVVAGHRLAAARQAGLRAVPVIVRRLSDAERCSIMLAENLARREISVLDEAAAYRRLVVEFGVSQRDLARRVGRSQSHISKRLALLELPQVALAALDSGGISLEDAAQLQRLRDPKRIEAVLAKPRSPWEGYKGHVEQELRAIEVEAKRAAKEAELRRGGHKVLPTPAHGRLGREGKLRQGGDGWRLQASVELPFSVERHAGESCHAAVVLDAGYSRGEPTVAWVCTNPARHGPEGSSSLKLPKGRARADRTPEEMARAEDAKAEREARKGRHAVARELLATLGDPDRRAAGVDQILDMVLEDANHAPAKIACQLLDIEVPAVPNQWGGTERNPRRALRDYAGGGQARRLQAALALVLGLGEEMLQGWGSWTGGKGGRHVAFLQANGWKPTAWERRHLSDNQGAPAAGDIDAGCDGEEVAR
jgi:ParB/RepB/Spo0J family partition protein